MSDVENVVTTIKNEIADRHDSRDPSAYKGITSSHSISSYDMGIPMLNYTRTNETDEELVVLKQQMEEYKKRIVSMKGYNKHDKAKKTVNSIDSLILRLSTLLKPSTPARDMAKDMNIDPCQQLFDLISAKNRNMDSDLIQTLHQSNNSVQQQSEERRPPRSITFGVIKSAHPDTVRSLITTLSAEEDHYGPSPPPDNSSRPRG